MCTFYSYMFDNVVLQLIQMLSLKFAHGFSINLYLVEGTAVVLGVDTHMFFV